MTSSVEENIVVVEGGRAVERSEADLVAETLKVMEEMWSARGAFDQIRNSKTLDTITHEDIGVRDEWRAKREEFIALLQALPEDLATQVDITPPVTAGEVLISHGGEAGGDIVGEALIRPEGDIAPSVNQETSDRLYQTTIELSQKLAYLEDTKAKLKVAEGRALRHDVTEHGVPYLTSEKEKTEAEIKQLKAEQKKLKKEVENSAGEAEDEARKKAQADVKRMEAEEKAAEEAEAKAKRVEEIKTALAKLYHDTWDKKQELEGVSENLKRTKATGRMIESAGLEANEVKFKGELKDIEKQKKDLEKELAKLENGIGKSFKDRFKESYEKTEEVGEPPKTSRVETIQLEPQVESQEKSKKKFRLWKWTKERVKTFFKDGGLFGEFVQAETMRQGTGHASGSAEALSTLIKTEWNIDNPDAVQDIANEALKVENKTGIKMDTETFGFMVEQVSRDRKEANDDEKSYIIKDAIDNLKTNLAKARGQATSESVLSSENLAQVEAEMKKELDKISDAAFVEDFKGFANVMRDNLDKCWWLRYLYGGAELAAVGGLGYYYLSGSNEAINLSNVVKPKIFIPETLKPPGVPDDVRLMMDHY